MSEKSKYFKYDEETVYEFTLAPDDEHQYLRRMSSGRRYVDCTSLERMALFRANMMRLFEQWDKIMSYNMVVEVSEPNVGNNNPRLHLHGTIYIYKHQALPFLLEVYPKLTDVGRIAINEYRPEYWDEYIHKQDKLWENYQQHRYIKPTTKATRVDWTHYLDKTSGDESDDPLES